MMFMEGGGLNDLMNWRYQGSVGIGRVKLTYGVFIMHERSEILHFREIDG